MTTTCDHCTAPTSNGLALCKRCQTTARIALENISGYHGDLFSLGGQREIVKRHGSGIADPTGRAAGRAFSEAQVMNAPDVAAADTRTELVGWARMLVGDRPGLVEPRDVVARVAGFLAQNLPTVATLEWAGEFVRSVLALEKRLRKIVERGKGRWYAGICSAQVTEERAHDAHSCGCSCHTTSEGCDVPEGCGPEYGTIPAEYCDRDLYAIPGTSYVRCPTCKTDHSVADRRAVLLAEARESMLPIAVIASAAVTLLGSEPSVGRLEARLRQWAKREQIRSYGVKVIGGQERRVYALGEVLDMLTVEASGVRS